MSDSGKTLTYPEALKLAARYVAHGDLRHSLADIPEVSEKAVRDYGSAQAEDIIRKLWTLAHDIETGRVVMKFGVESQPPQQLPVTCAGE